MTPKILKFEIEKRGLKKSWIAAQLKISNSLVSQWLNEGRDIQEKHQIELKKLFN